MRRWRFVAAFALLGTALLLALESLSGGLARAGADSRFGLDFVNPPGEVASDARFNHAAATGAGWDRFPVYWDQMQSSRSAPIDFHTTDALVQADLSRGLAIQGILLGAPAWAVTDKGPDLDAWASFVSQTVTRYRGKVQYWEIWNEPDLLDGSGRGQYWPWGVPAYYQLLKTSYTAAKAADPQATILLAGLAFPHNNEGFFPQLLAQMKADPTAAEHHGYFDILAFHSYDRVTRMYELPLGYQGSPSFAGFRPLLRQAGYNVPIWVNELGVPIWDYGSGQNGPGRATQDEQASYVVESLAAGLAAGVERIFFFQLYDDGAGAIDPNTNQPAEHFGLVANDGTVRPALQAYRSAIQLFSGAQATSHVIAGRGPLSGNRKGVEIVTLYGTNRGKVTVAWNNDPGDPVSLTIPSNTARATILDKLGATVGVATANKGSFTVSLAGATNNNNFDCYTAHGCDPNDYIIGGHPVILVEDDRTVPPAVFDPLPFDSTAPVRLSWHTTQARPEGATFDIQYRDSVEGTWQDWLIGTKATVGLFGDGPMQLRSGRIYEFRIRMKDAQGRLIGGQDYPPRALASTLINGGNVVRLAGATDTKIEIFWPHDNQPVGQATKANATVALFNRGTLTSVSPNSNVTLRIWRALDNGVAQPVAIGVKRLTKAGSLSYPVWDFNDLDVAAARDPQHRYYFWVTADGQRVNANVWAHGVDARTYFPKADTPTSVLAKDPGAVDAKIEIVWPHDNQPVSKATTANVGVMLFGHGSLDSVPLNYGRSVRLYRGVNDGPLEEIGSGERIPQTTNNLIFPTWQFNDIDVSAAQDPKNRIYFRIEVVGATTYSNIWTHGVDARTYLPKPDLPIAVAP